jgi:hypothetical protein
VHSRVVLIVIKRERFDGPISSVSSLNISTKLIFHYSLTGRESQ